MNIRQARKHFNGGGKTEGGFFYAMTYAGRHKGWKRRRAKREASFHRRHVALLELCKRNRALGFAPPLSWGED